MKNIMVGLTERIPELIASVAITLAVVILSFGISGCSPSSEHADLNGPTASSSASSANATDAE